MFLLTVNVHYNFGPFPTHGAAAEFWERHFTGNSTCHCGVITALYVPGDEFGLTLAQSPVAQAQAQAQAQGGR